MIKRVISISNACKLLTKNNNLIIDRPGEELITASPIEDISIIIINTYDEVLISSSLIQNLGDNCVSLVVCNDKHLPTNYLLPILSGHHQSHKVLMAQSKLKQPFKKQIWKSVVTQKINNQALALSHFDIDNKKLLILSNQITSGDKENKEALAANIYFKQLFGTNFTRDRNLPGTNSLLNYGYAIFRATMARAIVATGLNPGFGIFHNNKYNPMCLVDDLMEPFRPWIDIRVKELGSVDLTPEIKQYLIKVLFNDVRYNNQLSSIMSSITYSAQNYKLCVLGELNSIDFPTIIND
jgi:CRISPR-associated protein Cas1